jgi:tetratricopeptide (TPR) repeat protein
MMRDNSRRAINAGIGIVLLVVTLATYLPVLGLDFVNFDDPKYVAENPVVAGGLSPRGIWYAFTTFVLGNWIPLTWLSFELDATLFGISAPAFHAVNLAWHAANALLLYFVLHRMTGARGASVCVALLFAVHPLHVESVAWISERKDVLSTFWLLVTLLAYLRYALQPNAARMTCVCLTLALGLLAKPMLVTLPVLLLLVDIWPLRRMAGFPARDDSHSSPLPDLSATTAAAANAHACPRRTWRQLLVEKIPLFALVVADGIVTIIAQRSRSAMEANDNLPFSFRAANAIHGYGWYLWKTVWPTDLCAFYPLPNEPPSWQLVAVLALSMAAVSGYVIVRRGRGHLVFGWLWFVIALLPVSGLLQVGGQAYADRYAYVPHIGLFVMVVWEAERWFARRPIGRWAAFALSGAAVVACAAVSRFQIACWRNSETLCARALELDPQNYGAHSLLAMLRTRQQDWDAAEEHLQQILIQRPSFRPAIVHLGWIYHHRGETEKAAEYFAWALRLDPKDTLVPRGLAAVRSRPRDAAPNEAVELNREGLKAVRQGRMEIALTQFREAIALAPDYGDAHNNAGLALVELHRPDEAKSHFLLALASSPENADFHVNLGSLLATEGAWQEAEFQYEEALRLNPHDVEARFRLDQLRKHIAAP